MKTEANEPRKDQPSSLSLIEVLNIASKGYPDEYLLVYYDETTGKFNEDGSGDTLAEFIVREISDSFDPDLPKTQQLQEVTRVLRKAIGDLESVIKSVEAA